MRKFILAFILSILFIAFGAFLYNAYVLQKNYFNFKPTPTPISSSDITMESETPSRYVSYTKEDYEKALSEKRVLVLFFNSNWCKECLAQENIIVDVFKDLSKEGVVGLGVHILDSETTTETDALAKKFDITKESSFVVLDKNGAVAFKYVGDITNDILKSKILEVINK